nr:hypothetical protein BaRGS_034356 [Batillaria attramentaria]
MGSQWREWYWYFFFFFFFGVRQLHSYNRIQRDATTLAEADDGQYICRAERISNYETYAEKTGTLTVSQAQKLVQLVIDGKDPITGVRTSPVSLTAGAHPVRCVASGFSPASDYRLHLYRNNEELESVDGSNRLETHINLIEQHSGQTLRCVVKHTITVTMVMIITVTMVMIITVTVTAARTLIRQATPPEASPFQQGA